MYMLTRMPRVCVGIDATGRERAKDEETGKEEEEQERDE